MKIKVLPRCCFAEVMGTPQEIELLKTHRIISLNNSSGSSAMPPFSDLHSKNLLCLTVDDIVWKIRGMVLFNQDHALQIWNFVYHGDLPIITHCHAEISRSGAVGEVLNWYFNSYLQQNSDDFTAFYREHPNIEPNPHIRSVLLEALERRLDLKNGICGNLMKSEFEKRKTLQEEER